MKSSVRKNLAESHRIKVYFPDGKTCVVSCTPDASVSKVFTKAMEKMGRISGKTLMSDGKIVTMKTKVSKIPDLYIIYKLTSEDHFDNPQTIKRLLRIENYLRTCPSVLTAFSRAEYADTWIDMVNIVTFEAAVRLSGVSSKNEIMNYVTMMKTAVTRWPMDSEFVNISLWRKYNRSQDVSFRTGDNAPLAMVHMLDENGNVGELVPLFRNNDPFSTILVSSSVS
jgi:hypothetical protein